MRVFVTGASGFIGSAVVAELIEAGHDVLGLVRSEQSAQALIAAGGEPHRGDVQDLESLRSGAAAADGVAHLAFIHDFANWVTSCEVDRQAVETIGGVLAGSNRPFLVTSGTLLVSPGRLSTEEDEGTLTVEQFPRVATEIAVRDLGSRGVRAAVVRCSPSVHGEGDHGFIPMLIDIARQKGVSAYIGDGGNRWTGVHRRDAARLYRLALEHGAAHPRYHAADEEGIAFRDIAETIGRGLNVPVKSLSPEEAAHHFGSLALFAQIDGPASSKLTRERLGWQPTHPGLLTDMQQAPSYFAAPQSAHAG